MSLTRRMIFACEGDWRALSAAGGEGTPAQKSFGQNVKKKVSCSQGARHGYWLVRVLDAEGVNPLHPGPPSRVAVRDTAGRPACKAGQRPRTPVAVEDQNRLMAHAQGSWRVVP